MTTFYCVVLSLIFFSIAVPLQGLNYYHVPRVTNGWRAQPGEAPYHVALKTLVNKTEERRWYRTFCGAVIVSNMKLITAAHCLQPKIPFKKKPNGQLEKEELRGKYAVAGNFNNRQVFSRTDGEIDGQWRLLFKAYYPRKYLFPRHDIAVAITRKPFYYNENVSPVQIASSNIEYLGPCLVSGYGRIASGERSNYLILAYLDIMPNIMCNRYHQRNMDSFICTDTKVSDVTQGDSGGPLVCTNTGDPNEGNNGLLVGIVSGHRPTAGSFFTRVSKYNAFLEKNSSNSIHWYCNILVFLVSLRVSLIYTMLFSF